MQYTKNLDVIFGKYDFYSKSIRNAVQWYDKVTQNHTCLGLCIFEVY